ncbi:hypothetical protein HUB98_05915 [Paenibacillus barcinonensis]|uniref:Uncharacterized protein n=1 Tax=Paenibacillus barcinonensis TaxID=198119 RepID=A0A2V4VNX0_PAEBA|nr:hypothetical protein [Paenibacillus barcinonensis]PYE51541.1 hypothetical protein DFQ00_102335 [Paenibacillus barcinonensis]QKS55917.1 hypothetical protein HUB98_05915 [Paenibacillus barcinonensis]
MELFFTKLKKFMVECKDLDNSKVAGYYRTIEQLNEKLKQLFEECDKYDFSFVFYDPPEGYYSYYEPERIVINFFEKGDGDSDPYEWNKELNFIYTIELSDDMRGSYCTCEETDTGFDYRHKCCGVGCDWYVPSVIVKRHETVAADSFDGYEKDMWRLQDNWNGDQNDSEAQQKEAHKRYIQEQIDRLNSQMQSLD